MSKKALDLLSQGEFQKAHFLFTQELSKDPKNLEAKIGILLWDIAQTDKQKAFGILEFYYALLFEGDPKEAQRRILDLIDSLDWQENQEVRKISQSMLANTEGFSCISYEDFKNFILTKSNFKEAFEDFSLSTKIIFSHKEEVYEFLNLLIDKGYADLSMQYAENISENMGFDLNLNQILQKALKNLK